MTREETIGTLENAKHFTYGDEKFNDAFDSAINYLKEAMWIPVTERLPEEDGRYLCTYKNDAYGDGICIDFGLYEDGEWYVSGAIAWMPLPKPYEGSGTE